jgi:hypothetical protein
VRPDKVKPIYQSCIPSEAREDVVQRHRDGSKARCSYYLGADCVGWRLFEESGVCTLEVPLLGGKQHGVIYSWHESGALEAAEPWVSGLAHGVAAQWDESGALVGTYEMVNGTGLDLWWHHRFEGPGYFLAEARYMVGGQRTGYEWWLNEDGGSVHEETHWLLDAAHGVHRQWREGGALVESFPKFFVHGDEVERAAYEEQAAQDERLPRYRKAEDEPSREFPREVRRLLRR